jgi:protein O-GlcNAc transferase
MSNDNNQKNLIERAVDFHKNGQINKALNLYLELIKTEENNPQLLFLLGTAYVQLEKTEQGINYLERSLSIKPDNASAHSNLGNALKNLNRYEEALTSFDKAINLNPNFADAYSNRGVILQEMRRYDEALNSYDRAIEINPNFVEAYNNKGNALKDLKRYEEALYNYRKVFDLKPEYEYNLGRVLHFSMIICDWNNYNKLNEKINTDLEKKIKVMEPFSFLGISDNPEHAKNAAEIFVKNKETKNLEVEPITKKYDHKKPRIGYFSGDFHDHPVLQLMMDVFKNHDKTKFDIFGFSYGAEKNDKWRIEVIKYFNQFKDIHKVSDKEVLDITRNLELDIAIDLSGLTGNPRSGLFSSRVAPIQINYLGYPGTIGADYMDYIIADEIIIPKENFKHYFEKVLYLPDCYQPNMECRDISKKEFKRSDFGLPERAFIYCSFNNNYKITPDIFEIWMKILNNVHNSVLWILKSNEKATLNLKKEAEIKGINPDRIVLADHLSNDEHLKRIELADLFLDTFPYNAHTTASDAARMGTPIITLKGNSFQSRVGASILNCIAMNDLVTNNKKDYQNLAIELGTNPEKFDKLKKSFKNSVKTSSLFDSNKFTKNLEDLYLKILQN